MSFSAVFRREHLPFLKAVADVRLYPSEIGDHLLVVVHTPYRPQPYVHIRIGTNGNEKYVWTTACSPPHFFPKTVKEFREVIGKVISVVLARTVAAVFRENRFDATCISNWVSLPNRLVLVIKYTPNFVRASLETEGEILRDAEIPTKLKGKIPEVVFKWVTFRL